MGLFDLVFDELSKEVREAPGWLTLIFTCNLLLFVGAIHEQLALWGIEKEETTIATLAAMVLFFLGDLLDTAVFPREPGGRLLEKALKTFMLVLGGFSAFLLVARVWDWGIGLGLLWLTIFPTHWTLKKLWTVPAEPQLEIPCPCSGLQAESSSVEELKVTERGLTGWVWKYETLQKTKKEARRHLHIHRAVYRVSKALAQKAELYTLSIWFPNEAAKLIRSGVIPAVGIALWLCLLRGQPFGLIFIPAAIVLLWMYLWLKGLHMRNLYKLVVKLVENKRCICCPPCHGVRLFFCGADVVDCVKAEVRREAEVR